MKVDISSKDNLKNFLYFINPSFSKVCKNSLFSSFISFIFPSLSIIPYFVLFWEISLKGPNLYPFYQNPIKNFFLFFKNDNPNPCLLSFK